VSWVANLLLLYGWGDEATAREFSAWLDRDAPWNTPSLPPDAKGVGFLRPLTGDAVEWGGYKNPECRVWGGVLNHADLRAVVDKFANLPWREPGSAQLLVQDQEDSHFSVWVIRRGAVIQVVPPAATDDEPE
jgi:hypothetical protein